jgi:oligopeptide transport system substrate-binding protein
MTMSIKKMTRLFLLPVLALCFLLQTGCVSKKNREEALRLALEGEPTTLNPQLVTDIPVITIVRHLSEGLMRVNNQGVLEPALAQSVQVSEDGLRYHVVLRKEAVWAKNRPVTAHDFERSYKEILTHKVDCKYADQLFCIKGAKAIYMNEQDVSQLGFSILNEREFDIELEVFSPAFLYQLSTPLFFPVPDSVAMDSPSKISCGAYYVSEWNHRKELVLEKNPLYWDAEHVLIKKVICMILPEANTQFLMFNEKELDFSGSPMNVLPDEAVHSKEAKEYLGYFAEPTVNMLVFNSRQGPFSNPKMRMAFSLAINRSLLIQEGIYTGKPATSFVPAEIMGQELSYFAPYDPQRARALFEEALEEMQITKEELAPIRMCFTSQSVHEKRCQALEDQWYKLFGVHVQLQGAERKVLLPALQAGEFDIATASWVADFPDASNFLGLYYEAKGGRNFPGWQDESYRRELDLAGAQLDPDLRREHFLKAEKILMDNMVIAPVAFPATAYVCSKRVKNLYCSPMGYIDWHWASIEE